MQSSSAPGRTGLTGESGLTGFAGESHPTGTASMGATASVGATARGSRPSLRFQNLSLLAVLVLGAAGTTVTAISAAQRGELGAEAGELVLLAASMGASVVLAKASAQPGSWRGTRWATMMVMAASMAQLAGWSLRAVADRPPQGELFALTAMFLLPAFAGILVVEFLDHVRRDRGELLSDVGLVAVLSGTIVYLLLHSSSIPPMWELRQVISGILAGGALLVVAGWLVLAIWCPSRVHTGFALAAGFMGTAAVLLEHARLFGWTPGALGSPEALAILSLVGLTALLYLEPRYVQEAPRLPRNVWWLRPGLLAVAVVGTFGALDVAVVDPRIQLSAREAILLGSVALATIGSRSVLNQVSMARAAKALQSALTERESALAEREGALAAVKSAAEVLKASETRHRLLLDAAVDGIVELDAEGCIVRANAAFCAMLQVSMERLVGHRWLEVASVIEGDGSLVSLPETGQAVIERHGMNTYLEARASTLPTDPPGTLLLIRDMTSSRVAEQTIRTLFQFLQDRDEDRSRLLKRTNAAIEAERNRIARDLHDGPIQGVSAATLSLEAARLMVDSGAMERARDILGTITSELSEEATNMRRIMSDLRPPVLEERGLIPALRDLCSRLQREMRVHVVVDAVPDSDVPNDVETLAYRVVQEALSNIGKHARATEVMVRVRTSSGMLQVEVEDDGCGFEPADAREFLAKGKVGLASMRERTELAGGSFIVRSRLDGGTTVMAVLPFDVLSAAPALAGESESGAEDPFGHRPF
jgi:PAS domain S-box-containing protein